MRVVLVATLLLAAPLAFADAPSVHERNVAFIWSTIGEQDPQQPATMHDGRVVTLAEAIDEAAARAGPRDLAAMASGAVDDPNDVLAADAFGDLWIYSYGMGSCSANMLAPGSPVFVPVDPQFWIYAGGVGQMSVAHSYFAFVYDQTLKTELHGSGGWTATGNMDFFCIGFGSEYIAFPYVNGWFRWT